MSDTTNPPGRPRKQRIVAMSEPALVLSADEMEVLRDFRAMNGWAKALIQKTAVKYAQTWPDRPRPALRLIVSQDAAGA